MNLAMKKQSSLIGHLVLYLSSVARRGEKKIEAFGEVHNLIWSLWSSLEHPMNKQKELMHKGVGWGV